MWFQISYCKLIFKKTCHSCFGINQSIATTIWMAIKILLLLPTTHLSKAWFCSCVWIFKSLLSCQTLWHQEQKPTRLLCPWDSPGKNTEVGCHALLQVTFLTQGLNLCLPALQADSLPLSYQGGQIFFIYLN